MVQMKAAGLVRKVDAHSDFPDLRDRFYEPPLIPLAHGQQPPANLLILDQGQDGACTGFALAAAINLLTEQSQPLTPADGASQRMLYEMAKLHDEWAGTDYSGSSVRGAIKGFFHNGVCREVDAPFVPNVQSWTLTVAQAKQARNVTLGSYYRLRPNLVDYHAALVQAGAIVVSATIHSGWNNPPRGEIEQNTRSQGDHAFAIVGYDADGFIIQNSWGDVWGGFNGRGGLAHWSYGDWAENIVDAWVLRLAVPTPSAFNLTNRLIAKRAGAEPPQASNYTPRRQDVIGHIIHVNNGALVETGNYGTPMSSLQETTDLLTKDAQSPDRKYDHILFYAHGGVTDAVAAARKAAVMRDGFKRNRIYPINFIWETGLIQEFSDILGGAIMRRGGPVGGFRDEMDLLLEKLTAVPGRGLWRDMKADAERTFVPQNTSAAAVKLILTCTDKQTSPHKIHLVGHSAGGNFLCEFVNQWGTLAPAKVGVESAYLLAPACTIGQFNDQLLPALRKGLGRLTTYDLSDGLERQDTVGPYSKSLLYLVSDAFEDSPVDPLLGMQTFASTLATNKDHTILYAGKDTSRTGATSHGGYGTDLTTLNDILKSVCGAAYKPSLAFTASELAGA
jgi:hypothetical protein